MVALALKWTLATSPIMSGHVKVHSLKACVAVGVAGSLLASLVARSSIAVSTQWTVTSSHSLPWLDQSVTSGLGAAALKLALSDGSGLMSDLLPTVVSYDESALPALGSSTGWDMWRGANTVAPWRSGLTSVPGGRAGRGMHDVLHVFPTGCTGGGMHDAPDVFINGTAALCWLFSMIRLFLLANCERFRKTGVWEMASVWPSPSCLAAFNRTLAVWSWPTPGVSSCNIDTRCLWSHCDVFLPSSDASFGEMIRRPMWEQFGALTQVQSWWVRPVDLFWEIISLLTIERIMSSIWNRLKRSTGLYTHVECILNYPVWAWHKCQHQRTKKRDRGLTKKCKKLELVFVPTTRERNWYCSTSSRRYRDFSRATYNPGYLYPEGYAARTKSKQAKHIQFYNFAERISFADHWKLVVE